MDLNERELAMQEKIKQIGEVMNRTIADIDFSNKSLEDIAGYVVSFGFQSWGQDKKVFWNKFCDWVGLPEDWDLRSQWIDWKFKDCHDLGKVEREEEATLKVLVELKELKDKTQSWIESGFKRKD